MFILLVPYNLRDLQRKWSVWLEKIECLFTHWFWAFKIYHSRRDTCQDLQNQVFRKNWCFLVVIFPSPLSKLSTLHWLVTTGTLLHTGRRLPLHLVRARSATGYISQQNKKIAKTVSRFVHREFEIPTHTVLSLTVPVEMFVPRPSHECIIVLTGRTDNQIHPSSDPVAVWFWLVECSGQWCCPLKTRLGCVYTVRRTAQLWCTSWNVSPAAWRHNVITVSAMFSLCLLRLWVK